MAMNETASVLHKGHSMKSLSFIFLAALALNACGVGADEVYDGTTLVTQQQELTQRAPDVTTPNTSANATPKPSTVALPQDPIPLFEGKPLGPTPVNTVQLDGPRLVNPLPLR